MLSFKDDFGFAKGPELNELPTLADGLRSERDMLVRRLLASPIKQASHADCTNAVENKAKRCSSA